MSGKYSLQELRAGALSEQAEAERYAAIVREYDKLEQAGVQGKSDAEVMQQAITNLYGDKAPEVAKELAAYTDKYRIADAGEHLSAARKAIESVSTRDRPLEMPGGPSGASSRMGAAQQILSTRNSMRHPDEDYKPLSPDKYAESADAALKEIRRSEATLESWIAPGSKKQLTREQRAAVTKAYNELREMDADLVKIQSGSTVSTELTRSDVELARNARVVQSSGYAADHVEATGHGRNMDPLMKRMADRGRDVIHIDPAQRPAPAAPGTPPPRGTGPSAGSGSQSQGGGNGSSAVSGGSTGQAKTGTGNNDTKAQGSGDITGSAGTGTTEYPTVGATALKPQEVAPPRPAPKLRVVPNHTPGDPSTADAKAPEAPKTPSERPKLRVVPNPAGNQGRTDPAPSGTQQTQDTPPPKLTVVPHAGEQTGKTNLPTAPEGPKSSLTSPVGVASAGYITYSGIMLTAKGAEELGKGQTLKGSGDMAFGALNATTGIMGGVETVVPGSIEKIAGRTVAANFERAVPALMVAQAGFEVITAPDGQKGEAAVKAGVPMGASLAAGAIAGGGAAGFLLPIGVGVVAGMAVDRAFTMEHLREKHDQVMSEMKPDDAHTHLAGEAAKIKNTLIMAQMGDALTKGADGKVDLESQANLDKIKATLSPEQQKMVADTSARQADQDIEMMRQQGIQASAMGGGMGMDPFAFYSDKQMSKLKDDLTKQHEKQNLQVMGAQMELAIEARKDFISPETKLTFDDKGNIDLNNAQNLSALKTILNKEYDAAEKGATDTERSTYYWNLVNGEKTLREHIAQEEMRKASGTALAELSQTEWGAIPGSNVDKTPDQSQIDIKALKDRADAMAKANSGAQNVETDFTYTAHNEGGRVGDPTTRDERNEKLPPEVLAAYKKLFTENNGHLKSAEIDQVLYKDDGQGHMVPDKLVVWHILDPDVQLQAKAAASGAGKNVTYDGDHKTAQPAHAATGNAPTQINR